MLVRACPATSRSASALSSTRSVEAMSGSMHANATAAACSARTGLPLRWTIGVQRAMIPSTTIRRPGCRPDVKLQVAGAMEIISALSDAGDAARSTPLLAAAVLAPIIGIALYRFYLYSQLEYITAAMLTRHVPRDGKRANVIQVGGGSKQLYYYPNNVSHVTVIGELVNSSRLEQAGLQAGVSTTARAQVPDNLWFAASSSVDAVVALGTVSAMQPPAAVRFIEEAARVLKSGCPLIFVEKDAAAVLQQLRSMQGQWEHVEYDMVLEEEDPHVIGVAIRGQVGVIKSPRRLDVGGPGHCPAGQEGSSQGNNS